MNHRFKCYDSQKCASEFDRKRGKNTRRPCVIIVPENGMGTATPKYCPYSGTKVLFSEQEAE